MGGILFVLGMIFVFVIVPIILQYFVTLKQRPEDFSVLKNFTINRLFNLVFKNIVAIIIVIILYIIKSRS